MKHVSSGLLYRWHRVNKVICIHGCYVSPQCGSHLSQNVTNQILLRSDFNIFWLGSLNSPGFVPFGISLAHFGGKYDMCVFVIYLTCHTCVQNPVSSAGSSVCHWTHSVHAHIHVHTCTLFGYTLFGNTWFSQTCWSDCWRLCHSIMLESLSIFVSLSVMSVSLSYSCDSVILCQYCLCQWCMCQ